MKFTLIIDPQAEEQVVATVHAPSELTKKLKELVEGRDQTDRLTAYRDDELYLLPIFQIECITVTGGKTYAIDKDGTTYHLKQRLYEVEQLLPDCFIRINKSALANETRLERFCATFSGGVDAVFQSGYREYVSRRCFAQLKRRYEKP